MPKVAANTPPAKFWGTINRFSVAPTLDGYEVVDADGRSVTDDYPFANQPLAIAARLNAAASRGPQGLARALGAIEADDADYLIDDPVETLCHVR